MASIGSSSRINRACFASTGRREGDNQEYWRIVMICDNKTINMFDFSGKQVSVILLLISSFLLIDICILTVNC